MEQSFDAMTRLEHDRPRHERYCRFKANILFTKNYACTTAGRIVVKIEFHTKQGRIKILATKAQHSETFFVSTS